MKIWKQVCVLGIITVGSLLLGQLTKDKNALTPVDKSKAQAWAETVTDFVADPRLCGTFREADVAQRRVIALMKHKLRPPWHGNPDPPPGNGYYWVKGSRKQEIIPTVLVDIARSSPVDDGTPNEGPWVEVRFATELRANGVEM